MTSEPSQTPRLRLRRPRPEDAPAIAARYAADPEVTRYLGWPRHRSLDDTLAFVAFSDAEWARAGCGPLIAEPIDGGALCGSTGLARDGERSASTGYVLAPDAWGRGLATELLAAMVAWARALQLTRLTAMVHVDHRASQRVLEKLGFAREAEVPYAFPNLELGARPAAWRYARALDGDEVDP